MKVLLIIPSLHRGGAERVASLLTQEWARIHEVHLAVFDPTAPAYPHGGRLEKLTSPAKPGWIGKLVNSLRRVGALVRLLRRERPDRIISFMESANFPSIAAAALTRRLSRLTVSVRNDPTRFGFAYRRLIPLFYRLPAQVVAVSGGVAEGLAAMGVPRSRLAVIPNPASPAGQGSSTAGVDMPDRFLLAVGRLHPQKGFDRLLRCFASLDDNTLQLVILGDGRERPGLEAQAVALGIDERVKMPGAVVDPTLWYRRAACFVLSSRYEGWPNVVMESMSNGCPVVSFDCDHGPSEIIEPGVSGLLVEQGDVAAMRAAIDQVLGNNAFRDALVAAGRQRMRHFEIGPLAARWLA